MGFKVRFVQHIDAVLVAQLVPAGLVGVVGGAHGVDVEALERVDVLNHVRFGNRAAGAGIEFVAVDALEHNALAVELHQAVFDGEVPEADALQHCFDYLTGGIGCHHLQGVQRGLFGTPRADLADIGLHGQRLGISSGSQLAVPDSVAGSIEHCGGNGGSSASIAHQCGDVQRTFASGVVVIGQHAQVVHMNQRLGFQLHGTEDAVQTPEVLVLEPAGGREFKASHGQRIDAVTQNISHVELAGSKGILGIADESAIEPDGNSRGRALECQRNATFGGIIRSSLIGLQHGSCLGFQRELMTVQRHVVMLRHIRCHWALMAGPRVLLVDILMIQESLGLQCGGNFDGGEAGIVISRLSKHRLSKLVVRQISEIHHMHAPLTVQTLLEIHGFAALGSVIIELVAGMRGKPVDGKHTRVGKPGLRELLS